MSTDYVVFKLWRETHTNLAASNPVLAEGQEVLVSGYPSASQDRRKVGDGTTAYNSLPFSELNEDTVFSLGLKLNKDRVAMQELTSGTLTTSGWYTIAEIAGESLTYRAVTGTLHCLIQYNSTLSMVFAAAGSTRSRTHENTTIKIEKRGNSFLNADTRVDSFRVAKSDSVATAGMKLQVHLVMSVNRTLVTQLANSCATKGKDGIELVTPYLDNTPTLPDGVTVGTFLEAGAEFSWNSNAMFVPNATFSKATSDIIAAAVVWPDIPKQGTGLTLTLSSVNMLFFDGAGTSATLGSFTITNLIFDGNTVRFDINQVGIAISLNAGPLGLKTNGSGGKLTIT